MKAIVMARYLGASVTVLGILFGLMQPANAWYDICNKSSYSVYAAFGYHDGTNWVSEGWWDLVPGECVSWSQKIGQDAKVYSAG